MCLALLGDVMHLGRIHVPRAEVGGGLSEQHGSSPRAGGCSWPGGTVRHLVVPKRSDETTGVGRDEAAKGDALRWGQGQAKGGRVRPLCAPRRFDDE